jgi:glycine/D-amino acid oxidase-like deaminating enzyme
MLSFWEKEHFLTYDYLIVGGGIVGLSTAASIKERNPKASVLVLERGVFPTGASTKNAGFACFGSLTELLSDIKTMGEEVSMQLVEERWKGLQKLRSRLGDKAIDFKNNGGYEIIREKEAYCLDELDSMNKRLSDLFDEPVFNMKPEVINEFGFNKEGVKSVIFNPLEGQIDTGMMMQSLMSHVQKLGVTLLTGVEVDSFSEEGSQVVVTAKNGPVSTIDFITAELIICTNAFTPKLFPDQDIVPGRGIVLVTKPIEGLQFKGVFHYDEGYYYFRNHGNRVIFGGGRNLDFEVEATDVFEINERILKALKEELHTMILPNTPFEIDHVWSGIMAFGQNKAPIMQKVGNRVTIGVRLGGMGVAIGSRMGEKIAEMVS